tara:strand:- start:645 stop:854 length:210 start_codon:yes stop_codon:yes gene_type:complete
MSVIAEPIRISINDRLFIDTTIERLPVFVSITNYTQRSTLNPTAKPYVPNTPPLRPKEDDESSFINDSQ